MIPTIDSVVSEILLEDTMVNRIIFAQDITSFPERAIFRNPYVWFFYAENIISKVGDY